MSKLTACPECGTDIPADAPAGFCPKCLLQAGMLSGGTDFLATRNTDVVTSADANTLGYKASPTDLPTIDESTDFDPILFGDYELLAEIARGGMGVVYRARQVRLNRTVALKMILSGQFAGDEDVRRFQAEAEAAAQLDHPGIVPIFEVGEHDGRHYFSMAYISGRSLADRLMNGPLPPRTAATVMRSVAEAVEYAHSQGVIHRDLKPANILLDNDDQPRVTDFGLAKQVRRESGLTATGQILGTPGYMPPEQASGQSHDARVVSDVYALGAVLYCALTGRPPFQSDNPLDTLRQIIDREPVPPRQLNPAVPQDLETICLKCLQKDERKRYQSATEFATELRRFLDGVPIVARPIGRIARAARWCRRKPLIASLMVATALSLIVGSTVAVYHAIEARHQADLAHDAEQEAIIAKGEAEQARDDANEKLWGSYLAQSQAVRWSRRQGQRFSGLDSLRRASDLLPSLRLNETEAAKRRLSLRNEAVACLTLPDLRVAWSHDVVQPWNQFTAFDPKFERFAQGDDHGVVRIMDVAGRRELYRLPKRKGAVIGITFDRTGNRLAVKHRYRSGGREKDTLRLWHLPNRRLLISVPISRNEYAACFHPTEDSIAVGDPMGRISIYNTDVGNVRKILYSASHPTRIAWSRDGKRLAVCTANGLSMVLDPHAPARSRVASKMSRNTGPRPLFITAGARDVAWHPHDSILAVALRDKTVELWDLRESRRLMARLRGHEGVVVGVCFHPSGNLLASWSWDASTRLWDVATGREVLQTEGKCLQFSETGRKLHFVFGRHRAGLWEVAKGNACRTLPPPPRAGFLKTLVVHPIGGFLIDARTTGLQFRELPDGRSLGLMPIGPTIGVNVSRDGRMLYTSGPRGVYRWPVTRFDSGRVWKIGPPVELADHGGRIALTRDGKRLLIDYDDRTAVLLEVDQPTNRVTIGEHKNVEYVDVSPAGRWVATGTWQGKGIKVWDGATGKLVKELIPKAYTVRPKFSPDGKWLITTSGRDYQFWRTGTWVRARRIERQSGSSVPGSIDFSRDGSILAITPTRKRVHLIDPDTGRLIAALPSGTGNNIGEVCFAPSGSRLIVTRRIVECWDLRAIRRQLAEMRLNWPGPELPPAAKARMTRIEFNLGDLKLSRVPTRK